MKDKTVKARKEEILCQTQIFIDGKVDFNSESHQSSMKQMVVLKKQPDIRKDKKLETTVRKQEMSGAFLEIHSEVSSIKIYEQKGEEKCASVISVRTKGTEAMALANTSMNHE